MGREQAGVTESITPGASPPEQLRATVEHRRPFGPVHAALHVELLEVAPGRAVARAPAGDGGLETVLVLADLVLGVGLTAGLGVGERITTLRLAVATCAPLPAGGVLHAVGVVDHLGVATGLSSATITDGQGRPLARAGARNAVLRDDAARHSLLDASWAPAPRRWSELVDDASGTVRVGPDARNVAGAVQGGVLAGVAARGLAAAVGGPLDDLTVTYLRAASADAPLTRHVDVEHHGRRLRSARVQLRDAGDRPVLTASGSTYAGAGPEPGRRDG